MTCEPGSVILYVSNSRCTLGYYKHLSKWEPNRHIQLCATTDYEVKLYNLGQKSYVDVWEPPAYMWPTFDRNRLSCMWQMYACAWKLRTRPLTSLYVVRSEERPSDSHPVVYPVVGSDDDQESNRPLASLSSSSIVLSGDSLNITNNRCSRYLNESMTRLLTDVNVNAEMSYNSGRSRNRMEVPLLRNDMWFDNDRFVNSSGAATKDGVRVAFAVDVLDGIESALKKTLHKESIVRAGGK